MEASHSCAGTVASRPHSQTLEKALRHRGADASQLENARLVRQEACSEA